jgi:hypothetical protein
MDDHCFLSNKFPINYILDEKRQIYRCQNNKDLLPAHLPRPGTFAAECRSL